jgi:2-iminobutanoate/2-iminopropanoate deaminase
MSNSQLNLPPPISRFRKCGPIVFLSGQVGVRDGKVVSDVFGEQVSQALRNLDAVLAEAGASRNQIVKCNCFVRRQEDVDEFNAIYRSYFEGYELPARTTLVANPPHPVFLFEIEAVAHFGS